MNEPPLWMNLATEKTKSSAGLVGTALPNSVNLEVKQSKGRKEITLWILEVDFTEARMEYARKWERIEVYRQFYGTYQPVQASVHIFGL